MASETLRKECVLVKAALLVTVRMDSAGLGEDEFTDEGFVGRYPDT